MLEVPISRLRRELNKWIRYIDNNPDTIIYITKSNIRLGVLMSPKHYKKIKGK